MSLLRRLRDQDRKPVVSDGGTAATNNDPADDWEAEDLTWLDDLYRAPAARSRWLRELQLGEIIDRHTSPWQPYAKTRDDKLDPRYGPWRG